MARTTRPVARCTTPSAPAVHSRARNSAVLSGSIPHATASTSMKIGAAPQCAIALTVAMNVSEGTSTASPARTPAASRAMCSAALPFTTATACGTPTRSATSRSKRSTKGPAEDTQLVSRHSLR